MAATKRLETLRSRGDGSKHVLAVHLRHLEGTCYQRTAKPMEFSTHCHWTSQAFQGRLDQCDLDPSKPAFLQELQTAFDAPGLQVGCFYKWSCTYSRIGIEPHEYIYIYIYMKSRNNETVLGFHSKRQGAPNVE
jgi:hypothetical protein